MLDGRAFALCESDASGRSIRPFGRARIVTPTDVVGSRASEAALMTVAVLHRSRIRPLRSSRRAGASVLAAHSGKVELAAVAALYGLYEGVRGFGSAPLERARAHPADIGALEQHAGVFVERPLQSAVDHLPLVPA